MGAWLWPSARSVSTLPLIQSLILALRSVAQLAQSLVGYSGAQTMQTVTAMKRVAMTTASLILSGEMQLLTSCLVNAPMLPALSAV